MAKKKRTSNGGKTILLIFGGLACLVLLIGALLSGTNIVLLNPKGIIADEQRRLLVLCVFLLLEIAIPTLTLFYFVAWKYRESNEKATYNAKGGQDKSLVFGMWAIPITTMLLLAFVMWPAAHKLSPQRAIDGGAKPLVIKVVAMRWKWLFIYPEQNIATVNFAEIPVGVPVQFDLTADETPMSSFWIPQLGGQLYAMTGHVNRLNLMAEKQGDFEGSAAEINGAGFAGMRFTTHARSFVDFSQWAQNMRLSPNSLDEASYQKLLQPSENNPAAFFAKVEPGLYDTMLTKYSGSHGGHTETESE